ncbi:MAG: type II secretion system protein [Phycisphaerales bacterium]|nr:type II secretion system protein [Phycisphaerales bacterium]
MNSNQPRHSFGALRSGFTLLELVIVIGVILVLMGLALGVGSMVVAQSETRQLNATMKIVDNALAEFENQTGRSIIFEGDGGADLPVGSGVYYDVPYHPYRDMRFITSFGEGGFGWSTSGTCPPWEDQGTNYRRQWMAATLSVLMENEICAEMLAKADPALVHAVQCVDGGSATGATIQSMNQKEFVDPWQQQVYVIFPGRPFEGGDRHLNIFDADGTIRTLEETAYGICRNRRPLLVSAGPDSRFGDLTVAASNRGFSEVQDNIYSYEPGTP